MVPEINPLLKLVTQIDLLIQEARKIEKQYASLIKLVHPYFRKSAKNLLHYLALRHHDIRDLQEDLAALGLSSLGRAEEHVLATLQAVRKQLCFLMDCPGAPISKNLTFTESFKLLPRHTNDLLGPSSPRRSSRIMVTFSTDLATDHELVSRMLKAGMNCARINCAHDDKIVWEQMISNVKKAAQELGVECKVLMDLMGPKLRTGPLKPGPKLISIHPVRDEQGQITAPAKIWLAPPGVPPTSRVDAVLPLDMAWLAQLMEGDRLRFKDTRGRKRKMAVIRREGGGVLAHLFKTSYFTTGTELKLRNRSALNHVAPVGELLPIELPIQLKKDDFLVLHKDPVPGEQAQYDAGGHIIKPAHISCTLPEVFGRVKVGQPIMFDDGEIEGEIEEVNKDWLLIKITAADEKGSKLRSDKGINLPESDLCIIELTEKDKEDLAFIAKHADIVNLSFVNHPETVMALQKEINKHKADNLAIMLKIETKEGFKNLPHLLLAAMQNYPAGIMIARGDLAVECGWQRLAEVQEEILWLCEAAHLPVVWATQVLETLAKKGRPSRAEITDAAMAQRADCVMLNKGPHVVPAIRMLDNILERMQEHQHKKTSMLRSLHVSELEHFYDSNPQPLNTKPKARTKSKSKIK